MLPRWLDVVADPILEATKAPAVTELHGELLRQWGSSEVWRLSFGLNSVIVKRGTDGQADEAAAYERYVVPLDLPAPELIHRHRSDDAGVLVLADVGRVTLEQEPTAEGFAAGAELLATIRGRSVDGPSEFPPERVAEMAARIGRIEFGLEPLTEALAAVHRDAPTAVVHGDFVPKNLVTDGTDWTAIDWPGAYQAPHLSDLYTLVRDAAALGHDRAPIVAQYTEAIGGNPAVVERQMLVGGGCFYLVALMFIVEEGLRTIPESVNWIDGLLTELHDLVGSLA
ncbi:phosphotransferase family protein [Kribbella sp. NPDC054772]